MKRLLITGGAGFIGVNFADYFAQRGWQVTILDNLSRTGTAENLAWVQQAHPEIRFVKADVRYDQAILEAEVAQHDSVYHLAAQVAVTTSVARPREDFEINALGTLNVLEAVRLANPQAAILYASTNKVYGGMEGVAIEEGETQYRYRDYPEGMSEEQPLDFHSPYGCSKGAADQYVHDYGRIYGLQTVVFRQSCIYGPRQFGIEDQGWIAWFTIAALMRRPITIYGDGKQVRDVLYIDDLARAWELATENIDRVRGQIFNIGGGRNSLLAVREVFPHLEAQLGRTIDVSFGDWRPGDQRVYMSDIRKAQRLLGWEPKIMPTEGIARLIAWAQENTEVFARLGLATPVREQATA